MWDDKNDHNRAIADLDQAIRLDPKYSRAYNVRGVVWKKKGDLDRAHRGFHATRSATTRSRRSRYANRGDAWDDKGDQDRAIADLSEAIRINPNYARAYNIRGVIYRNRNDLDRAIADYTEAVRADPKYALAYMNRGNVYKQQGDNDRAIADYTEAIAHQSEVRRRLHAPRGSLARRRATTSRRCAMPTRRSASIPTIRRTTRTAPPWMKALEPQRRRNQRICKKGADAQARATSRKRQIESALRELGPKYGAAGTATSSGHDHEGGHPNGQRKTPRRFGGRFSLSSACRPSALRLRLRIERRVGRGGRPLPAGGTAERARPSPARSPTRAPGACH